MRTYKREQKGLKEVLADRYLLFALGTGLMFIMIICQFYKIQIMEHDIHTINLRETTQRTVEIPAVRGCIYDRYGKPLAINESINVLKFNPEIKLKEGELDKVLLRVINTLEAQGEVYIDAIPITKTRPFTFTEDTNSIKRFIINDVPCDSDEREALYQMSAAELIAYLRSENIFNIDSSISDEEARKILAMRIEIRQTTYQKYKQVTLAESISMKTVAAIEENQQYYPGITIETEGRRLYTYGKALGNVLGYTRKITESQYEMMEALGYERTDIVGQVGIEAEEESELRGEKGNKLIEIDNVGRTVFTLEENKAVRGNDIYLSLDAELQVSVYEALEKRLAQGIVMRLKGEAKTLPLKAREILISMVKDNQIDLKEMSEVTATTTQKQLYQKLLKSYEMACKELEEKEKNLPDEQKTKLSLKAHLINLLEDESNLVSEQEVLLVLAEQGSLTVSDEKMKAIKENHYDLTQFFIEALENGEVKPDQMSITPCSGTAVVVNPNNGETLALVSYPSYDNNDFIKDFNSIFIRINDGIDDRNLEVNRALKTAKAPGSTFKMITGIAGLEEGVVTPETLINDTGQFTKAGNPPLRCWIFTNTGSGHGDENMEGALEVSCNYYFSEVAYRLGEKFGAPYGGIKVLSEYAELFGLGEKSGIELEEVSPNVSSPTNAVTTQAARALNKIRYLNEREADKNALYEKIEEYLSKGFYMISSSDNTAKGEVQEELDNLIKQKMDEELSIVLSEGLESIYQKLLEDYQENYQDGTSTIAAEVAGAVMNGDTSLSLKYRTKTALKEVLIKAVSSGTKKKISKALAAAPEGWLKATFLEAYEALLTSYREENKEGEVMGQINEAIMKLKEDQYDYTEVVISRVIERMLQVYLDDYFKEIEMEWTSRDNISSAIGQGEHAYTPVQMARYIAGIANAKKVYNLTILNGIRDNKRTGTFIKKAAVVFNTLNLQPSSISTIRQGMRKVAAGDHGTARKYYADSRIELAAKTGTAQEGGHENSWVVSFAPYNTPEVAVAISMYGTDGVGSCTYEFLNDIYSLFFRESKTEDLATLGNQFAQ